MKTAKYLNLLLAMLGVSAQAATYTWTGAADSDWDNTSNWLGGLTPVDVYDGNSSLDFAAGDLIIFSGNNAPDTNVPLWGGNYNPRHDTPSAQFDSGGTFNLTLATNLNGVILGQSTTVLTIGDGVMGGTENVVVNLSGVSGSLIRDTGVDALYVVHADGSFNLTQDLALSYLGSGNRDAAVHLIGGAMSVDGTLDKYQVDNGNSSDTYIDFQALGASFTADYGADFANLAAVQADLAATSFFRSSTGLDLDVVDNSGIGFTITAVAAVPEPGSTALLSIGGLALLVRRRR